MALIAGTNSYVTLEEANEYLAGAYRVEAWTGASEADREAALITASRQIDRQPLRGAKAAADQPLQFPRAGQSEVPEAVIQAVCEQALFLLQQSEYDRMRELAMQQGVGSVSIGDASETIDLAVVLRRMSTTALCPAAQELLRPWLAGRVVRIV